MSVDHYENFPVASVFLPKRLRQPVAVIYHILRSMDDIADEGNESPDLRQKALDVYQQQFDIIKSGKKTKKHPFDQLGNIVTDFDLPVTLFEKMLIAFRQDIHKNRYQTEKELLHYCQHSANPVGHMMLILFDANTAKNRLDSDRICTALQLINFWQDISVDYPLKNRCYIPLDTLNEYELSPEVLSETQDNANFIRLMKSLISRTQKLMLSGSALPTRLFGRVAFELKLIVMGGLRITEKIEKEHFDTRTKRPTLTIIDWLIIFTRALFYKRRIDRYKNRLKQTSQR